MGKSESALINPSSPTGLGDGSVPVHYTFRAPVARGMKSLDCGIIGRI